MKNNKLIYILSGLVIMIATLFLISKVFLNDLFFDIKTGEDILKYGIDFKDHFSFIPNLIYIYHHWFYDVIIYFIYNSLGYHGIFFFFLLIYTIFGFILLYVNKKLTNSFWVSILVTLVTIYICGYAFQSRVQSITYLLFFLEVFFIDKLYNTGKFKYSIYIFLISILIANMHMPLWIFTLILYLPYIFEFIIKFIIDKSKRIKNIISDRLIIKYPCNKRLFITTFIILIFTGLLSPLKLYPYTFFLKSLGNKSYSFIGEMSKTVLIDWKEGLIFIILLFIILFLKNIKIKLRDLSLLIGLFLFALIVNRNFIYFYIFFPTIFVKFFKHKF